MAFDYERAFSRNIGIIPNDGQTRLRNATVAIAGMGGVGGDYLLTLCRAGIGRFHISDFDAFDLVNFNRQYGANITTIGRPKMEVMHELALQVNPEAQIKTFGEGVNESNMDEYLDGVDVVVDGIEFFEVEAHRLLIRSAVARGLPVVAAVPVGFGAGMLVFTRNGMEFDDYFAITQAMPLEHKVLLLSLGFAPAGFHIGYVDPASFDLRNRKGPSFIGACKLCAGMISAQVVTALLWPEELRPAPWFTHFDARLNRFKHARLLMGNRNPVQRLKFLYARRLLGI